MASDPGCGCGCGPSAAKTARPRRRESAIPAEHEAIYRLRPWLRPRGDGPAAGRDGAQSRVAATRDTSTEANVIVDGTVVENSSEFWLFDGVTWVIPNSPGGAGGNPDPGRDPTRPDFNPRAGLQPPDHDGPDADDSGSSSFFPYLSLTTATVLTSSLTTAEPSNYWVVELAVSYAYDDGSYTTYMRMCVPEAFTSGAYLGLVVLVTGSQGVGVECVFGDGKDDAQMAVLASGAPAGDATDLGVTFGRTDASPMAAVSYNNPGFGTDCGAGWAHADGSPDFANFSPNDTNGDEFCGPQSAAALEAVVVTALEVLTGLGAASEDVKLIVSSFSNGVTCATGWMKDTTQTVHAFIDDEGPMDSAEQTLATECYSATGERGLPSELNYTTWADCAASTDSPDMRQVFGYYWRPPDEALPDMLAAQAAGAPLQWPVELAAYQREIAAGVYKDPADLLADSGAFWDARRPLDFLNQRRGAYIRIQFDDDHVQPKEYNNRHAVRAMLAASVSGCGAMGTRADVYFADTTYFTAATGADPNGSAPLLVLGTGWEADDSASFPEWPGKGAIGFADYRGAFRVDMARWAVTQTFDNSCS